MQGNARSLALLTSVALACSARGVDQPPPVDASVDRPTTTTDVPVGVDTPTGADTPTGLDTPIGADVQVAVDVPLTGASQQIAAVRASAPGVAALRVDGAVVTYVVQPTIRMDGTASPTDPGGFFVQADRMGPALFVAVNAATLTPAPAAGDRVSFTVTRVATPTSPTSRWAAEVGGYTRDATGVSLGALTQDVSNAADLVTGLQGYEHELITVTGTLTSDFGPGGTGFVQASFATAALPADPLLKFRIPTSLQGPLGLRAGCRLTIAATPLWRFDVTAQPSAWTSRDVLDTSCPTPGMDAGTVDVPTAPIDVPVDRSNPTPDLGTPTGDDRVWVVRVGDGVASLAGTAAAVNIEAYNGATGAMVGSPIALPTTTTPGGNLALTLSGTAGAEGFLFRSLDQRFVVMGGYEASPGSAAGLSAVGQRVIARINAAGVVDTRTSVGATATGMTIRAVATVDGSAFWSVHTQTSVGDVVYTGYGGSPAGAVVTSREVFRSVAVFGQQLLVTGSNSSGSGVFATSTLPRAPGGVLSPLPGFPSTSSMSLSPYGVAAFDRDGNGAADVIFFADDRTLLADGGPTGGGLQCWRLIGGTWTSMGNVTGLPNPLRGLTGRTNGADYVLYGVTSEGRARLLRIDVSATTLSGAVTVIAQAPMNMSYRGVAFAPR